MDLRIEEIIKICKFEKDTSAWKDIFSNLFNDLTYETLFKWHNNRDKYVNELINSKIRQGVKVIKRKDKKNLEKYFDRIDDGRLITKEPIVFIPTEIHKMNEYDFFTDQISKTTIANKLIYLGENVQLSNAQILSNCFIRNDSKILFSNLYSTQNTENEAIYIGEKTTVEGLNQLCKSAIGSSTYAHINELNGGIVGGSSAISAGVGMQSHWTQSEKTELIDMLDPNKIFKLDKLTTTEKSKIPTIIGHNCRIGGGVQITSPLIIGANNTLKQSGSRRKYTGLYHMNTYFPSQKDN